MSEGRFWPVGDFHDGTTRILAGHLTGFSTAIEAELVISKILQQQLKPHHVTYRVAPYPSFQALVQDGVKT